MEEQNVVQTLVYSWFYLINTQYLANSFDLFRIAMWFKNLFGTRQAEEKNKEQILDAVQFQNQENNEESSPLLDLSPDLRYQSIESSIPIKNLPVSQNMIDKSETIIYCKLQNEDGWAGRSSFTTQTQIKIVCTDKKIILQPNILAFSSKSLNRNFVDVPLGQIEKIQIKENKKEPLKLVLTLKDNRQLIFTNKLGDQVKSFYEKLSKFAQANGINKFFAFQYKKKWTLFHSQNTLKGWQIYSIRKQFMRQGAYKHFCTDEDSKKMKYAFRLIKNHTFDVSPTYPPQFVVPFNISKEEVVRGSKFRTRQRVPALTFYYEYKSDCFATLFRCSQIKAGLMGNRCQQDQKIIKEIAQSSNFISKTKKIYLKHNLKIYDARGYYAALGNMLAGKGYEKEEIYNCQVQFLNIPNIHAVRDSYVQVKSSNFSKEIYEVLTTSCWLEYVGLILSGAKQMAIDMMAGKNVLVHCSDGWDRTAQLSSLCQLLLDPYFRTLQGIAVLIEKDWRNFGHKFRSRTGQYHPSAYHPHQKSPVFIQFLDCIYQVQCQFPLSFQYNSHLLQFLAKHLNSCVYGTFLTNNIKEATQIRIQSETVSIWTDVIWGQKNEEFINPFYQQHLNSGFMNISLQMKNLRVWRQHLFEQQGQLHTALFAYKKQQIINRALREKFYANQQLIKALKEQFEQQKVC